MKMQLRAGLSLDKTLRRAGVFALTILIWAKIGEAAAPPAVSGAATLIQPLSSLTLVSQIDVIPGATNITLIPVGQFPVLATNITYTLVVTNPINFSVLYDWLLLTYTTDNGNGAATPPPPGPGDAYECSNIIANVDGIPATLGQQCTSANSQTIITFATNSLPNIEYYTQITTNLFFDPNNPLCWQTVYVTNITVDSSLETNFFMALCGNPFTGAPGTHGTLKLAEKNQVQSFFVQASDLLDNPSVPPAGLAVFLGNSICDDSFQNLGIMVPSVTNATYTLNLVSPKGVPLPFVTAHLSELTGKLLQIRDQDMNIYAQAVVPALVAVPNKLSFNHKFKLIRPAQSPSKKATGEIEISFDGLTGRSLFQVLTKGLDSGSSYTVALIGATTETYPLSTNGTLSIDTGLGTELPFGVATASAIHGITVDILDAFGTVHLAGAIP